MTCCCWSLFLCALLGAALADTFVVKTLYMTHMLKNDRPPLASFPDPSCSIVVKLAWPSDAAATTACISRQEDTMFNISIPVEQQTVLSADLADVPANPAVEVAVDCWEDDCPSPCTFEASCETLQEDDVRAMAAATFFFVANASHPIKFAVPNFVIQFELLWNASAPRPDAPPPPTITFDPLFPTLPPGSPTLTGVDTTTDDDGAPKSRGDGPAVLPIAIGVAVAVVLLLLAAIGGAVFWKRKRTSHTLEYERDVGTTEIGFEPIAAPRAKSDTLQNWEDGAATTGNRASAPDATLPIPSSTTVRYERVPTISEH